MDLDHYQKLAGHTDRTASNYENEVKRDVVVALLGIAGELGTLATTYKKYLRDGGSYDLHNDHVAEEIGDLLWYCATLATKFDLSLESIAKRNIAKVGMRWSDASLAKDEPLDAQFAERFPRKFSIHFSEETVKNRLKAVMRIENEPLGDPLTDNTEIEDDYRFHDAFHLAFLVEMGWSPVLRALMGLKRRSNARVDEQEDGGRAIVIEEGIAALVFDYGTDHHQLDSVETIDYELIRTIQSMTRRLEVKAVSGAQWQRAIRSGWKLFRELKENRGGVARCDLDEKTIFYERS